MLHRQRRFAHMRAGRDLAWVSVHEKSPRYGFHSQRFELRSRRTLARLAGGTGLAGSHALRFRRTYAATVDDVVEDCWRWYRYLMKQLDPKATIRLRGSLKEVSARDVLMPWHFRTGLPLESAQIVGGRHRIWTQQQREQGFVSRLRRGELDDLYLGNELRDGVMASVYSGVLPP